MQILLTFGKDDIFVILWQLCIVNRKYCNSSLAIEVYCGRSFMSHESGFLVRMQERNKQISLTLTSLLILRLTPRISSNLNFSLNSFLKTGLILMSTFAEKDTSNPDSEKESKMRRYMLNKDADCLANILESIQKIEEYVVSFNNADELNSDTKSFDAVLMNFIVISEMAAKLSDEFRISNSEIEWWKIKGLRNIVAHDYFGVDAEEIWQIIKNWLPRLKSYINNLDII